MAVSSEYVARRRAGLRCPQPSWYDQRLSSRLHEVSPAHVQGLQNNEKHFKELLFAQALGEYL